MKVASLYICPWSLYDPLCQSQSLAYLRGLVKHRGYKFALITFENPKYAVPKSELVKIKQNLKAEKIYWYPIKFRSGLSLTVKAFSNLEAIILGLRILRKHRPRIVHSRSSVSAFLALILAKAYGIKFLYDADSALSEEYAATGHLTRSGKSFQILAKTESLARQKADETIVLTEKLRRDFIDKFNVSAPIEVIPCCVDTEKFQTFGLDREKYRNELGLGAEEKLLVYVGKIGERYLVSEIFGFFKAASDRIKNLRILIISNDAKNDFDRIAESEKVGEKAYFVRSASFGQVRQWLSAADAGIALIKNSESERGASPIKIGEYLAAGLPVVISNDIGDVSSLIREKNIGTTVENYSVKTYEEAADNLEKLWKSSDLVSERCRRAANDYFSLEMVGIPKYIKVYERIMQNNAEN